MSFEEKTKIAELRAKLSWALGRINALVADRARLREELFRHSADQRRIWELETKVEKLRAQNGRLRKQKRLLKAKVLIQQNDAAQPTERRLKVVR